MVARFPDTEEVTGSNPVSPTKFEGSIVLRLPGAILSFARLLARLLRPSSWRLFLTRGDRFLVAFGRIYVFSIPATETFRDELSETFQGPGRRGTLFVKWPRPRSVRQVAKALGPALLISGLGRFGNSIIQLANAADLALHVQATTVVFFRSQTLRSGSAVSQAGIGLRQHTLLPSTGFKAPTALWRSDFIEGWPNPVPLGDAVVRSFRDNVFPSLNIQAIESQHSGSVLTIHLRSGDVYGENPHPAYGQPPLSFYEAIIGQKNWSEVRLVSEDQESPCWGALVETCSRRGIPLRLLGESFEEALTELASASNLVASRGTFIPAILFLFPKKRRVYFFGRGFYLLNSGHNLELVECEDVGQQYTESNLSGDWKNTATQRDLMLTYPANLLTFCTRSK